MSASDELDSLRCGERGGMTPPATGKNLHELAYATKATAKSGGKEATRANENSQPQGHQTGFEKRTSDDGEKDAPSKSIQQQAIKADSGNAHARQWSAQAGGGHAKQVEVPTANGAVSGTTFAKEGKQYLQTKDGSLYEVQQHNDSPEGRLQPVKPDFSHAEAPPVNVVAPIKIVPDRQVEGALALQPEPKLSSPISDVLKEQKEQTIQFVGKMTNAAEAASSAASNADVIKLSGSLSISGKNQFTSDIQDAVKSSSPDEKPNKQRAIPLTSEEHAPFQPREQTPAATAAIQSKQDAPTATTRPTGSHESMFQQSARSGVILEGRNDAGTMRGGTSLGVAKAVRMDTQVLPNSGLDTACWSLGK